MRRPLTLLVAAATAATLAAGPTATAGTPHQAPSTAASVTVPAASPEVIKLRYGTFPTTKVTGKGSRVVKLPKGATRGLVTLKAKGEGTVKVQVLSKKRKAKGKALVSRRPLPYTGTTVYGLDTAQYGPTYLKVTSTSREPWTVTVKPLHKAAALKKKHKGTGDTVLRITQTRTKTWSLRHKASAKSLFDVRTYGLTRTQELFSKKVTTYSGKVRVEDFSGFVVVRSQGSWTIKR